MDANRMVHDDYCSDSEDESSSDNEPSLTTTNSTQNKDPDDKTTLDPASLDLLEHLLSKAQAETESHLSRFPASEDSQTDFEELMAASQFVAQVEREDYMCTANEEENLQEWMNTLVSRYAEDPEMMKWINRVNAVQRSVGSDEGT